jgi:hypothetical protein
MDRPASITFGTLMETMMRLKPHELTSNSAIFAISAAIAVMFMGGTLVTPLYVRQRRSVSCR